MKTGNTPGSAGSRVPPGAPQWSPVMKTGNTVTVLRFAWLDKRASMEPGHEDREYLSRSPEQPDWRVASMEPGHEDREYLRHGGDDDRDEDASMEPGHEDREYYRHGLARWRELGASMEPGHEDREYLLVGGFLGRGAGPQWSPVMKTGNTGVRPTENPAKTSLNGARS